MTKEEILERTLKLYSECDSFRAVAREGGGESFVGDLKFATYTEVETKFIRPHWVHVTTTLISDLPSVKPMAPGVPLTKVIASFVADEDGAVHTFFSQPKLNKKFSSLANAVKLTTPAQGLLLVHLLMMHESGFLKNIKGVAQFADKIIDGENCYHLVVYHGKKMEKVSLWINVDTGLVKQLDVHENDFLRQLKPMTALNAVGAFLTQKPFQLSTSWLDPYTVISSELNPPLDKESFFLPL